MIATHGYCPNHARVEQVEDIEHGVFILVGGRLSWRWLAGWLSLNARISYE